MALSLTELQAITEDYYLDRPVDINFLDCVLLWKLMGGGKMDKNLVTGNDLVDGGRAIRVFLEYDQVNGGTYGNSTVLDISKKEILNAARFRWAGYHAVAVIDLDDQVQNEGKAALVDLVSTKLSNAQKTIRDYMGSAVYASAANSNAILGLGNLFNTTTSIAYGEIAQDDMADWKANVITTSEAISFKVLQAIRRAASVGQNKSDKPNLYITTELLKDGYERTLQTQARYSDVDLVNAGFENVLFGGAPVVPDDKQSSGICDALNLNYLAFKTHKDYNFTKPVWEHDMQSPDTLVANTRWIGQMVCKNRKAHCRHTNLSEPA